MNKPVTTRRFFIYGGAALAASGGLTSVPHVGQAANDNHPAITYMHQVAKDLLAAQRSGSVAAFRNALGKHADIHSIGTFALGRYRSGLKNSKRNAYYRGVQAFMARYFAGQTKKYQVVKADINSTPRIESGGDVLVNTSVQLASGSNYTVIWRLAKRRGRYRVTDLKVLGFSLSYLQRGIFYRFLTERNGDVNALIAALNR